MHPSNFLGLVKGQAWPRDLTPCSIAFRVRHDQLASPARPDSISSYPSVEREEEASMKIERIAGRTLDKNYFTSHAPRQALCLKRTPLI
jgi:hypothetical protein